MISKQIMEKVLGFVGIPFSQDFPVNFTGPLVNHGLPMPLDEIIAGVLGAQGHLIAQIWDLRNGGKQEIDVNILHSYLSLISVGFVRQNGYILPFDETTIPTTSIYKGLNERYIFLHGGYPKLRDRILLTLNCPNEVEHIAKTVSKWDVFELEEAIAKNHGCAGAIRSAEEWKAHPQGKILNAFEPLIVNTLGETDPIPFRPGERPLSGIRVLDLTHVIAAPTSARILAEQGADVLHITAPHLPKILPVSVDTGRGKRQTSLDLRLDADKNKLRELIKGADVFVEGWRPGKMNGFGFSPQEVIKIKPGIIYVSLSCYGVRGPWGGRPGWEQLGQSVSGLVHDNRDKDGVPIELSHSHGIFPCDYTTGNLAAVGILAGLIKRHHVGGSYHIHISLTRTGMWLQSMHAYMSGEARPIKVPLSENELEKYLEYIDGPMGHIRYLKPVLQYTKTHGYFKLSSLYEGSGPAQW